jgi:hypothetical protein
MLETLLKEYKDVCIKMEELKTVKEELNDRIKSLMTGKSYDGINYKATLTERTTFKYNDEVAMLNYIKKKGLSHLYIVEQIDTKKLNAELKLGKTLYNDIKPYIEKTITESLKVEVK